MTRLHRLGNASTYRPRLWGGLGSASIVAAFSLLTSAIDARLLAAPPTSHGRNCDEANVGIDSLPDPLLGKDGLRPERGGRTSADVSRAQFLEQR